MNQKQNLMSMEILSGLISVGLVNIKLFSGGKFLDDSVQRKSN